MNEFELIKTFFHNEKNKSFCVEKKITIGIGDDAAVFDVNPRQNIVTSLDTLVAGVHFPSDTLPKDIAYKALAVNLSDLAAMGASPHSFTLSITLPNFDEAWLTDFSEGLFEIANAHQIVLLGGDTSKGPLSISIQVNGLVDENQFLTRSAGLAGDILCTTGHLGLAALGLQQWQAGNTDRNSLSILALLRPQARVRLAEGFYELGIRCCIDISDGLFSEVRHLCQASRLSAVLDLDALHVHPLLNNISKEERAKLMFSGDDYELCFSVPKHKINDVEAWFQQNKTPINKFGEFVEGSNNEIKDPQGKILNFQKSGYTHF